tara:strand:+ start:1025 stop:1486 length:462 start_codon:yes stop_codon:yes gene_type:complete
MMAKERTPRENEMRGMGEWLPSDDWVPASILPVPHKIEGWTHRWVRTRVLGHSDNINVSKMMREGWEPCKFDDYPEMKLLSSDIDSKFVGNVEIGGLLLCKAPEEKIAARTRHFQKVAADQMESVDNNFLRENDPRMPLMKPERNTRTTFGRN